MEVWDRVQHVFVHLPISNGRSDSRYALRGVLTVPRSRVRMGAHGRAAAWRVTPHDGMPLAASEASEPTDRCREIDGFPKGLSRGGTTTHDVRCADFQS